MIATAAVAATGIKSEAAEAFVPARTADLSALHDQPLASTITCASGDAVCATNKRALAEEQLRALTAMKDGTEGVSAAKVDWAGHSSMWGMAAPPIQGALNYDEMLDLAKQGEIATVQIAVQHDQLIATLNKGHRFSFAIKDEDVPWFVADAMNPDGTMPFEVLPIDETRQKVRSAGFNAMSILGVLFAADELDLLPWDTNNYGSLKAREEAKEQMRRGEGLPVKPKVTDSLRAFLAKRAAARPAQKAERPDAAAGSSFKLPGQLAAWLEELTHAASGKRAKGAGGEGARNGPSGGSAQDEALRRVLGFSKWDAAAELKDKQQRKEQQKVSGRTKVFASIRTKVLESKAHQKVVAAHETVLESHKLVVDQHDSLVHDFKLEMAHLRHDLDEIRQAVRATPWLTPLTVDRAVKLPTLEQLLTDAHEIGSDGTVAQYIRAHSPPANTAFASPHPKAAEANEAVAPGGALSQLAATAEVAPLLRGKDPTASGFESELDGLYSFCRLCPEFSALYGHRVYICKRPVLATA